MKHIIMLTAIVFATGLVAAETASAQFTGNWAGYDGMSATATYGSFGQRNVGGMNATATSGAFGQRNIGAMVSAGNAGTFARSNNIVTGEPFNMDPSVGAGFYGIGNFEPSAFVGGGGVANGFVGGLANRGINPNLNGGGVNQLSAFQYGDGSYNYGGIPVQFNRGGYARTGVRNTPADQSQGPATRPRSQMPIHVSYVIDFPVPPGRASAISAKLSNELSSSPTIGAYGPVTVQLYGKTALLRGTVASEHDRDLAAELAMLEPGVDQVRNELRVASVLTPPQGSVPSAPAPNPLAPAP